MEEERGHFSRCQQILNAGLHHCPLHEALMLKAIKHHERMGSLGGARSLLGPALGPDRQVVAHAVGGRAARGACGGDAGGAARLQVPSAARAVVRPRLARGVPREARWRLRRGPRDRRVRAAAAAALRPALVLCAAPPRVRAARALGTNARRARSVRRTRGAIDLERSGVRTGGAGTRVEAVVRGRAGRGARGQPQPIARGVRAVGARVRGRAEGRCGSAARAPSSATATMRWRRRCSRARTTRAPPRRARS